MQGKNFLKITGIIMIVGGGLTILADLFAGLICTACVAAATESGGAVALAIVGSIIGCAGGILELIAGIMGVKYCDDPTKANLCMVLGIIVAVLALISVIMSISGSSSVLSIIISIICSIAVPVLYVIGAVLNKKSA